jgi:hypothetical protein
MLNHRAVDSSLSNNVRSVVQEENERALVNVTRDTKSLLLIVVRYYAKLRDRSLPLVKVRQRWNV